MENRNNKRAVAEVRRICSGGKLLAMAILMALLFAVTLINRINDEERSLFGMLLSLIGELDVFVSSAMIKSVAAVANVVYLFGMIALLPMLLTVIGLFMVRLGGDYYTERILKGLNILKLVFLYYSLAELLSLILALASLIPLLSVVMKTSFMFAPFMIVIAVVLVYFCLRASYFANVSSMIGSVAMTVRTGSNLVVSSLDVTLINWIYAVFIIITSLSGGFMSILCAAAEGAILILFNLCFSEYKSFCGTLKGKEMNAKLTAIVRDPANKNEIHKLGFTVGADGRPVKAGIGKMIFGTEVMNLAEPEPEYTVSAAKKATSEPPAAQYTPPAPAPEAARLTPSVLTLFGKGGEAPEARYTLLGERVYKYTLSCPVTPVRAQVFFDSLSENRILRMRWRNVSEADITSITFNITARDNACRVIACLEGARTSGLQKGEEGLSEIGIPLPEGTTNGVINVTHVEFSDGLCRSKISDNVYFTTSEKDEYDVSVTGVGGFTGATLDGVKYDATSGMLEFSVVNKGERELTGYRVSVDTDSYLSPSARKEKRHSLSILPGQSGVTHRISLPSYTMSGSIKVELAVYDDFTVEGGGTAVSFGERRYAQSGYTHPSSEYRSRVSEPPKKKSTTFYAFLTVGICLLVFAILIGSCGDCGGGSDHVPPYEETTFKPATTLSLGDMWPSSPEAPAESTEDPIPWETPEDNTLSDGEIPEIGGVYVVDGLECRLDSIDGGSREGFSIINSHRLYGSEQAVLDLPDEINGFPVYMIDEYGFYDRGEFKSVILPSDLEIIGNRAFDLCVDLESMYIPKSVHTVGTGAFRSCGSLARIYYDGTAEEWDMITVGDGNEELYDADVYFYSPDTPPDDGNNYWHYVDGIPTAW